jgi:hypothetical protein
MPPRWRRARLGRDGANGGSIRTASEREPLLFAIPGRQQRSLDRRRAPRASIGASCSASPSAIGRRRAISSSDETHIRQASSLLWARDRSRRRTRREDRFEGPLDLYSKRLAFIDETWVTTDMARMSCPGAVKSSCLRRASSDCPEPSIKLRQSQFSAEINSRPLLAFQRLSYTNGEAICSRCDSTP